MSENPPIKHGYHVIERKCRIVFDVNIRISEITPQSVAGYFIPEETGEGSTWEWAERQNRLLQRLIEDEEALNQYVVSVVKGDLGMLLESEQIKGLPADEEDELLERVYSGMDDEDARFFREARVAGILYDNVHLADRAFVTDWSEAELIDLHLI